MEQVSTYVGLDVHQKEVVVSMLVGSSSEAIEFRAVQDGRGVRRLVRKLEEKAVGRIECAYEAGPCGYTLQRQLRGAGIKCQVVAPSLIPIKPGERIKTDRRDARKLAEHLRAGLLTEVHPPSEGDEAVRDLCRCREDAKEDLMRVRHRLGKMLLRRGRVYRAGRNWTKRHREWLGHQRFEHRADQAVFEDYLLAIEQLEERVMGLDERLSEIAASDSYRERVGWLRCFRGIDTVAAMTILAELHDFARFQSPRHLMAYLGLVPSEHSSGQSTHRGAITKSGNRHVRRMLVQVAWHYRHRPAVGAVLRKRRGGQPAAIIAIADRAQQRLNRRYCRLLLGHHKPHQKVVIAVARELVGFLWAALYRYPSQKAQAS
jgi:transposase